LLISFQLSISFPTLDAEYLFELDPLYAAVDVSGSTFTVTPNKVEVSLKKVVSDRWSTLEGDLAAIASQANVAKPMDPVKQPTVKENAPAYPTSSRNGAKNWDKLAKEVDDEPEGDETAAFFKNLYGGASDEVKRAMMKSYQESNGTVLSTNWAEVGSKKVETQPPDGMESRHWE
jgi:suppressor of G2 allele of SKP1